MRHVVVREHARLTTGLGDGPSSLEVARVSETAFEWLCAESARLRASGAPLVQVEGRRWLRLDNYVGVLETPCGTRVEILPKSFDADDDAPTARALLRKMLARCMDLRARESAPASIQTFDGPLTEWVMQQFLLALDGLIKRGLRSDYRAVRDQQRFLRGRLELTQQVRQPAGRQHLFRIEHDVFDADRPENRLLRSALDRVCRSTVHPENWRLSHELATRMAAVPPSADVAGDFRRWRDDRLLAHYRPARSWCALILGQKTPLAFSGEWQGRSLLFPMEALFERYVEVCLRATLPAGTSLRRTPSSRHLCMHRGESWFRLQPDFMIEQGERAWILDTKWKRLDASLDTSAKKYGLSQSDFYQLFAYGHRYLPGAGDLLLIFPRTTTFHTPLTPFEYSESLRLHVVPFDLEHDRIEGPLHWDSTPRPAAA